MAAEGLVLNEIATDMSEAENCRRLTCEQCGKLVVDYVDGALPPEDDKRLKAHIGDSQRCKRCVESYKRTKSLCGKALEVEPDPTFGGRLIDFLRSEAKKSSNGKP